MFTSIVTLINHLLQLKIIDICGNIDTKSAKAMHNTYYNTQPNQQINK